MFRYRGGGVSNVWSPILPLSLILFSLPKLYCHRVDNIRKDLNRKI